MPVAKGRTTANKTITLPDGGTVLVPVITQLNVVDPVDRYQETDYTIINTVNDPVTSKSTTRQVHVDQIDQTGNIDNSQPFPPGDPSLLAVERVDVWNVLEPVDRAQETDVSLFNDQSNYDPNGPPFFTRHKASHVVRVQNDPDDGNYVDVELIDELDWVDPADRGQETHLQLNQPQGTYDSSSGMNVITADSSDPDITDTSSGIDPPFRLDPFQNIVGYGKPPTFSIGFQCQVTNDQGPPGTHFVASSLNEVYQPVQHCGTGDPNFDDPCPGTPAPEPFVAAYVEGLYWNLFSSGPAFSGTVGSCGAGQTTTAIQSFPYMAYYLTAQESTALIGSASGGQLVVNGKPIIGYLDTLTLTTEFAYNYLAPIGADGIYFYCNPFAWWIADLGAATNIRYPNQVTWTVSSAPFTFHGKTYQAIGILDPNAPPPPVYYGNVYCIRI